DNGPKTRKGIMADLIETKADRITTLTLNRADSLNALSLEMIQTLIDTLNRLATDSNTGAIVITGAGRAFCAGGDVKNMAARAQRGFEERVENLRHSHQVPQLVRTH